MEEQHRLVSDANYCYHLEAQDYSFRKKRNCLAMLFTSLWEHGHESWQLSQESDVCYGKSQLSVVFAKTYYFLCAVCFRWLKCTSCMKGLLNWQRCSTLCFVQFVVFINCLRGKQNCIRFETCGSRCESLWAKLMRWSKWFTYFQVCTGPSQIWILYSTSSWKKKRRIFNANFRSAGKAILFYFFIHEKSDTAVICLINKKPYPDVDLLREKQKTSICNKKSANQHFYSQTKCFSWCWLCYILDHVIRQLQSGKWNSKNRITAVMNLHFNCVAHCTDEKQACMMHFSI